MPEELLIIKTAKEFGVLPDDIENKMSERWWNLYKMYLEELQRK